MHPLLQHLRSCAWVVALLAGSGSAWAGSYYAKAYLSNDTTGTVKLILDYYIENNNIYSYRSGAGGGVPRPLPLTNGNYFLAPGEMLVLCRNPALSGKSGRTGLEVLTFKVVVSSLERGVQAVPGNLDVFFDRCDQKDSDLKKPSIIAMHLEKQDSPYSLASSESYLSTFVHISAKSVESKAPTSSPIVAPAPPPPRPSPAPAPITAPRPLSMPPPAPRSMPTMASPAPATLAPSLSRPGGSESSSSSLSSAPAPELKAPLPSGVPLVIILNQSRWKIECDELQDMGSENPYFALLSDPPGSTRPVESIWGGFYIRPGGGQMQICANASGAGLAGPVPNLNVELIVLAAPSDQINPVPGGGKRVMFGKADMSIGYTAPSEYGRAPRAELRVNPTESFAADWNGLVQVEKRTGTAFPYTETFIITDCPPVPPLAEMRLYVKNWQSRERPGPDAELEARTARFYQDRIRDLEAQRVKQEAEKKEKEEEKRLEDERIKKQKKLKAERETEQASRPVPAYR